MSRIVNFFIQKEGQDDNVISIFSMNDRGMHDMYKIVYKPHDSASSYTFYYNRYRLMSYIYNLLQTLGSDIEPFSYIQVMTSVAPTVMYNIPDLSDSDRRNEIMEAVTLAVEACPVKNESS